tara:strand:+ start:514 stop:789 length:276 start_codon:yes stop_codon:yes gene_type:complete
MNSLSVKELEILCNNVQIMTCFHQKEVLKILNNHKDSVTLNENKNGVLVNLTDVSDSIISEIKDYIEYVNNQEKELNDDEEIKIKLKKNFF